jgi:NAD(P)-dependent dehydrogenase (short-subunit alcohol dehydrogenase family)
LTKPLHVDADVVTFLASSHTNYMTGMVIPVDGGTKRYAH